ncbi:MAG: putative beta-Ala-His dipeptidase [Parcubacteria group bacterium GW2011_GWB1_46_8]|nr:MAG: putative beta-Ala-His dipeptidase [Parcubacteria group bacterium GW2011_GWF1_45_5]KKU11425.1 MAG: putative beta-Ala-His dipeptidase [Parcubacteria group bacterium GW2011_GWA1_45_7]KKU46358.1 MAG: putative beta-Ala-His dipeptidase [Parcubacteria group bacterium GW2011_GWB1_46_8]
MNYKQLLSEVIKFQSASTDAQYQDEIQKTVNWYKNIFETDGFKVNVITGYDNPIIIASYAADPQYKTCLIYGHYDVQPASKNEGWDNDPFTLTEKNGRLVARGVIDNKGQNLVHISTVIELIKEKSLGYNVTFMIEGNEETGSPHLETFIKDNQELLEADFVMISDGEISGGVPNIEVSFRGGFNSTLTVTVGTQDLHSGLYGSAAPNAIHELGKVIASLYDKENKVAVPGFYDDVLPVTQELLDNNKTIPYSTEEYKRITGRHAMLSEQGYDFYTQTGLRPAIEISGIQAGYMGDGYRNAIPYKATAKINFRLVKNQNAQTIIEKFKQQVRSILPEYADFVFETVGPYEGVVLDTNNPYVQKAKIILELIWQKNAILKYNGGGLPIATYFDSILNIPQVLIPLANEDCNMHGANENFAVDYCEKGLAFSKRFLSKE